VLDEKTKNTVTLHDGAVLTNAMVNGRIFLAGKNVLIKNVTVENDLRTTT
jgi:hypothetical protein